MEALATNPIQPALDFATPHHFIDTDQASFAYWKTGTGPDLALVHGWPLHAATYRNVIPHLRHRFTCHLFDLPGAGKTITHSKTQYDLHSTAHSFCTAINTLGISHYGIIAHDSGGAVARVLADIDAEKVTGLVLADTEIPNAHSQLIRSLISLGKHPIQFELFIKLLRFKIVRHSQLGFGGCFHDPQKMEGEFYNFFIKPMLEHPRVLQGQRQLLSAMKLESINALQETHQRLNVPVLLLWGANDPFFPLPEAQKMLSDFKHGEIRVFEEGKLFVQEEFSEAFAEYVGGHFTPLMGAGRTDARP